MATALLFALALMAQDAPVTTAAPPPRTQPAATPPTDEYGYIAWCYGALGGYIELYDKVMPEVTRIEKAFPGPDGAAAALKEYPVMRNQARVDLKTYATAITAAEKASPRPISEYGAAAMKKGRSIWGGSDNVDKARLAQVWMSWSPPGDCETRAKTLETKSNLFGQALNYNVKSAVPIEPDVGPEPEAEAPPPPPPAAKPAKPAKIETSAPAPAPKPAAQKPVAKPAASAPTPAAKPAPKPVAAETAKKPLAPIGSTPAKLPASREIIIDPANPQACAGSLLPAKRGGKDVLICKPD
jgi:cell division septation protein DedD